jgi:hypothetical protein
MGTKIRGRLPMGYVLASAGFICALVIVFLAVNSYRSEVSIRDTELAQVEAGYARLRNQVSAAGLTPSEPSLPILLGPEAIGGNQGAPPLITFTLTTAGGPAVLTCSDPTGAGKYTCTTKLLDPKPSPPTTIRAK